MGQHGSDQQVFKNSLIESGRVTKLSIFHASARVGPEGFQKLDDRVGSGQEAIEIIPLVSSGRVMYAVGSDRITRFLSPVRRDPSREKL